MKRKELLQQTKDQRDEQTLSHTLQQEELQAQADLLETQKKVAELKQRLEDLKSAKDLLLPEIVATQVELEGIILSCVSCSIQVKKGYGYPL